MLLDGYHNKKRYGSIQAASDRKIFDNDVVAELKSTFKHDFASCLSRVVASIRQTKGPQSSGSLKKDTPRGADSRKSTLDWVLNDQRLLNSRPLNSSHHQRSKSVKQLAHNQQWIPSVKSNLTRSSSVQQRKLDTSRLKLRYQMSTENCHRASSARKSNKIDTPWSFGINKFSVASLLPIVAYLALATIPISVISAPILQQQQQQGDVDVHQPAWLAEGLFNLDNRFREDSESEEPFFLRAAGQDDASDQDHSPPEQALLNILAEKQQRLQQQQQQQQKQQPSGNFVSETFGRRLLRPSWSPFGREILTDAEPSSSSSSASAEQFWVQRRRLDRNRALEPAPWMREQPMRRGYNPNVQSAAESGIGLREPDSEEPHGEPVEPESSFSLENGGTPIPGRKLRQSSDEVYDEVLKYLIEEAFQGQDFINELYDELERKSKTNTQLTAAKLTSDGSSQLQPGMLQQQQKISNQQNSKSPSVILDRDDAQASDPNSALVVLGDEVSSGDGPAPAVESSQTTEADSKTSFAQAPSGPPTSMHDNLMSIMSQQQIAPATSDHSPYTLETPIITDAESQSRYSSFSGQEPFHVLEEIDQVDDPQSIPTATSTQQQQLSQSTNAADSADGQSLQPVDWLSVGVDAGRDPESPDNSEQLLPSKRDQSRPSSWLPPVSRDSLSRLANYKMGAAEPAARWISQEGALAAAAAAQGRLRSGAKVGIALRMIESGYLSNEQLEQVATKLKSHLEDMIGLMDGSILDLYPLNPQQLLIKLDTSKLSALQIMDMIQKYGRYHHHHHHHHRHHSAAGARPSVRQLSWRISISCGANQPASDERVLEIYRRGTGGRALPVAAAAAQSRQPRKSEKKRKI